MASAQGGSFFPCSHKVQDSVPAPAWCSHRPNYQIMSIFIFPLCIISICLFIRKFCILSLECAFNFNQIKENFLDFQRRNNSSVSPSQAIACTCPFTGFNQPFLSASQYLSLPSGKGNQIFHFVSFWFYFITVITIIVKFWILIFTLFHILRITVWEFSKEVLSLLSFLLFLLVDL